MVIINVTFYRFNFAAYTKLIIKFLYLYSIDFNAVLDYFDGHLALRRCLVRAPMLKLVSRP